MLDVVCMQPSDYADAYADIIKLERTHKARDGGGDGGQEDPPYDAQMPLIEVAHIVQSSISLAACTLIATQCFLHSRFAGRLFRATEGGGSVGRDAAVLFARIERLHDMASRGVDAMPRAPPQGEMTAPHAGGEINAEAVAVRSGI